MKWQEFKKPALMFGSSEVPDFLHQYEVLLVEPLHTIIGHIKNLYQELPWHLSAREKKKFDEAVELSFGGKEVLYHFKNNALC